MTSFVALLRAVNVGGTGRLAMTDLKAICEAAGMRSVRTYVASGNVVFESGLAEPDVKTTIEAALRVHARRPIGVLIRTAAEMAEILARNPFPEAPGNRVMVVFLDRVAVPADLDGVTGRADHEELRLGRREIHVRYGAGMAASKLRIPAATTGTARNMNTVVRLVAMLAGTA